MREEKREGRERGKKNGKKGDVRLARLSRLN
jgi:hypothetical protein